MIHQLFHVNINRMGVPFFGHKYKVTHIVIVDSDSEKVIHITLYMLQYALYINL